MIYFIVVSGQGLLLVSFPLHFKYLPGWIFWCTPDEFQFTYHCAFLVVGLPLSLVTPHVELLCLWVLLRGRQPACAWLQWKFLLWIYLSIKDPLGSMCTMIRVLFLSGSAVRVHGLCTFNPGNWIKIFSLAYLQNDGKMCKLLLQQYEDYKITMKNLSTQL